MSQKTSAFPYFEAQIQFVTKRPTNAHMQKYPTKFPLYPYLKSYNVFSLLVAQNFKSLIKSHDLTAPSHLSPNVLVLNAPATLTFSEFFSGMFSLSSSQEKICSPLLPYSLAISALANSCYLSSLHLNVTLRAP